MDLHYSQKAVIRRMLMLNRTEDKEEFTEEESYASESTWKVLVYDKFCQSILNPLFNVQELRDLGITLHLLLEDRRERVPDVPAIYFVSPTSENIDRISEDISKDLYDSFHLNFSSALPRDLLESLAAKTVKCDGVNKIAKVFDQYSHFISLEPTLVTFNQQNSFVRLNGKRDDDVKVFFQEIVDSLFCLFITLGVVPVIRCQKGGASEMVAEKLNKRLYEHLIGRTNLFNDASSHNQSGRLSYQRPVLILVDRYLDLAVPLHHTWIYQGLIHDLLKMKANRIAVAPLDDDDEETKTPDAEKKPKFYDLHTSDPFWVDNAGLPFPEIAANVDQAAKEYQQATEQMKNRQDVLAHTNLEASTQSLSDSISKLPQLQENKKYLDMHTNIATVLLNEMNARDLANLFMMEENLMLKANFTQPKKDLLDVLTSEKCTAEDKLRFYMIHYLSQRKTPKSDVEEYEKILESIGADLTGLGFLKKAHGFVNPNLLLVDSEQSSSAPQEQTVVSNFANLLLKKGASLFNDVKNLLPANKLFPITRITRALLENIENPETDKFLYFDPKSKSNRLRQRGEFQEAVVFVIGGGNYVEFQNLEDYAAGKFAGQSLPNIQGLNLSAQQMDNKRIIYGCTQLVSPLQFLDQLRELGLEDVGNELNFQ